MKYIKYLLILLLIPFIVLAEECDISKITITSMEQNSIEGNTEVISEPTFKDRSISLNLKMYEVGDSITYDITIKNDSNEDYMIDEDTFKTDSDYIEYSLVIDDNNNVVKANSSKNISLMVTYKKEIDDNLLSNNKYDASNSLKISLNTKEKEKELDIITTDNIKESVDPVEVSNKTNNTKIDNPLTSDSIKLITIILLTAIAIVFFTIINKKKYNKYLILILSIMLLPVVYAICKCDIEVESKIEIEKLPKLFDTLEELSKEINTCITKYDGKVTDEVGKTVNASNVYINKCTDKRNVIFGGFCWQIVRTTETEGTKLIYNGEPVNGKCEKTRGNHRGLKGYNYSTTTIDGNILLGETFSYNSSNNTFTLKNTKTVNVSFSNNSEYIDYYTCGNTNNVCNTLTYIGGWYSDNTAMISIIEMNNTDYSNIGSIPFNVNYSSPAMVGYMYNNYIDQNVKQRDVTVYMFGSSYTYDEDTNTYTVSGNTVTTSSMAGFDSLNSTRYTCWNTTGTCDSIAFIYKLETGYYDYYYYINLKNGENITNLLNNMINDEDVNKTDSAMKSYIDAWYENNLMEYSSKLENAIYCNNRSVKDLGGWNQNGGNFRDNLLFANSSPKYDLSCNNITDQFSLNNDKAKLKYSISLISNEEFINIDDSGLLGNDWYWTLSPNSFQGDGAYNRGVNYGSVNGLEMVSDANSVRPAISLKNDTYIKEGTGLETDPWIIE